MIFEKEKIDRFARDIRKYTLTAIATKGSGHVGGSLSIADALAVLYGCVMHIDPQNPALEDRDVIVLSKGHCGPAMYAALALKGYFPLEELKTLNANGTRLPSHTDRLKTPGVDMTTGSLGQGASLAAGVALADRLAHRSNRCYLILGDGELQEGQVWESMLFAAHQRLHNLVTLVDVNGKQLDGTTDEVCCLGSLEEKFRSFGFHVVSVQQGNDTQAVYDAICQAHGETALPTVILLHTVKGAGVPYYEQMKNCHSVSVSEEDLERAVAQLEQAGGAAHG